MVCYIPYPKVMRLLTDRLEATPEELAAWVWMGPKINGLSAYINANELDPPPRFYYDDAFCSKDADYISPLMACWFNTDDISNFTPVDRYITGIALIERWNTQPGIQSKAFIQAKIEESRLNDHHPIYGGTKGSSPEGDFPPLESGLFLLSEIELIEKAELDPSLVRLSEQYPALEKNTFESQKNNPLLCFQEMDKLRFNEIKILIDPDNLVLRISARDRKCTVPFAAIGLTKKNEVTLNKQGEIFMAIANGDFLPMKSRTPKAIDRLSRLLRDGFKTTDSPFLMNKPQFELSIPKVIEAKRRALKRTTPYNDNIGVSNCDNAQDFLQQNDRDYDPKNPMYSINDEN